MERSSGTLSFCATRNKRGGGRYLLPAFCSSMGNNASTRRSDISGEDVRVETRSRMARDLRDVFLPDPWHSPAPYIGEQQSRFWEGFRGFTSPRTASAHSPHFVAP